MNPSHQLLHQLLKADARRSWMKAVVTLAIRGVSMAHIQLTCCRGRIAVSEIKVETYRDAANPGDRTAQER